MRRAPSAFLQQAAEFGFLLPLLLIALFGGVVIGAWLGWLADGARTHLPLRCRRGRSRGG
jgi:hypothetical protein